MDTKLTEARVIFLWENIYQLVFATYSVIMFQVDSNKTIRVHGSVQVVLLPEMAELLQIYVSKVRAALPLPPQFFRDTSKPVFCNYNGKPMQASDVARNMTSLWNKSGCQGKISPTLFRKGTVTMVRYHPPYSYFSFLLYMHYYKKGDSEIIITDWIGNSQIVTD